MSSWTEKIENKRRARENAIPEAWRVPAHVLDALKKPVEDHNNNVIELELIRKSGILSDTELKITEDLEFEELLSALALGKLTSVDVVTAFSKRAAVAQQLVNCLTEIYFDEAIEQAKRLDELHSLGRLAGPLHGLPISLKDSFQVTGSHATLGVVSYLDHTSEFNSPLVDILLELGAVIYVKTNVPQTLATVDTDNNIFGRTLNTWNTKLGAGGSSGGEGALAALHGSPLGVGTDVGGSIRIPSLCCGTYSFKPTENRIPYGGQKDCLQPGMDFILAFAGPLGHSVQSLEFFMKAVIGSHPARLDSTVHNVPWRSLAGQQKAALRVGVLPEDPRFPLHPTMKRALSEAARKLQAHGNTLISLENHNCHVANATETAWKLFGIDDAAYRHVQAGQEDLVPSVKYTHGQARNLGYQFIPYLSQKDRLAQLAVLRSKRALIADDWREIWFDNKLDLVLCPSAQSTAVVHDRFGLPAYTALTNILNVNKVYTILDEPITLGSIDNALKGVSGI
ncbi:amidase [Aspergillus ellipticus CBS 707.79]|uniref:Amidase n=1 Tax=Aspergillus ellipticus CBS 707.79 TaxID=1448320 RepID=A0A319E231_9EURO|nr:amidase [Aspergillus ellipticus CBS 707.79]